jgi:hypothetical protein
MWFTQCCTNAARSEPEAVSWRAHNTSSRCVLPTYRLGEVNHIFEKRTGATVARDFHPSYDHNEFHYGSRDAQR